MVEVTLTFTTQSQADTAVMVLSNGYRVEQFYMAMNSTIKPYVVRVWVPNDDVAKTKETDHEESGEGCGCHVKPEEEKWIAYLCRRDATEPHPYLTSCVESKWEAVQKIFGAKTKLFVGTDAECTRWYESRQKFAPVIKAWEDGKTIQIRHTPDCDWVDLNKESPKWHTCYEYRAKPEDEKPKRMTYRQLAEWLAKGNGQYKTDTGHVYSDIQYSCADDLEVALTYKIRYWGCDGWIEPLAYVYKEACV